MKNVNTTYTKFHVKQSQLHTYPTEWVIRTMLGSYPGMRIDKKRYENARILDMGFGDARNMPLLKNIGLEIYGVEITNDIVELAKSKLEGLNIHASIKVGTNTNIPFENNFFDIILASSSCYYVDDGNTFEDNMKEYLRVLKKDGILIANFPEKSKNFITQNCIEKGNGHIIIQSDDYGLRNGYTFRVFTTEDELKSYFSSNFYNISTGYGYENYYGHIISQFYMVAYKR